LAEFEDNEALKRAGVSVKHCKYDFEPLNVAGVRISGVADHYLRFDVADGAPFFPPGAARRPLSGVGAALASWPGLGPQLWRRFVLLRAPVLAPLAVGAEPDPPRAACTPAGSLDAPTVKMENLALGLQDGARPSNCTIHGCAADADDGAPTDPRRRSYPPLTLTRSLVHVACR
jgi:hypothetical protein